MSNKNKLKSSVKYPTSLIIGGDDFLAVEIAKSLIEQGGYVVIIDRDSEKTREKYEVIKNQKLLTILDYSSVEFLDDDLRRLDYVFYLGHNYDHPSSKLSSQEFLQYSNYLDLIINLTGKYKAKMLLSSSIKANQIILNSREEIDFGKNTKEKHAVYSQTEMQRYAEALVFEAMEKLDLDARIVRLGRVVGPGMDFDLDHSFDQLVMEAVMGKDLKLKSDGLESNMYVHVLDAAYGIIKAMFTKETSGKIYSVSNDEEITDLSIAYKLQELVGLDQEIKFDNSTGEYPAIRYHKPAKSLTTIGWLPRVSFHRALVQSFDYAKQVLVQEANRVMMREDEITDDVNVSSEDDNEPKGALARLIAERKAQELSRRGSILIANEKLKDQSKAKRKLTAGEKVSRAFQSRYDSLTHKLRFLKKITLSELVMYALVLAVFSVIYIGFLAPVFVMFKNLVLIEYYNVALERHIDTQDYQMITGDVGHISENVTEFSENHARFEQVYVVLGARENYQTTQDSLSALSLHIQAISDAFSLNSDFYELVEGADYSLVYRPTGESLLDLGPGSIDEEMLAKVLADSARANQLDTKIEITSQAVRNKPVGKILGYDLSKMYEKVYSLEGTAIKFSKFTQNFSEYFLSNSTKTYTMVLQDDSRYTPSGGYPAAIGIIQIRGGELSDIELSPLSEEDLAEKINVEEDELEMIQVASTDFKSSDNVTFADLFLIPDKSIIEDDLNEYVDKKFSVESQAIFFANTGFLKDILAQNGEVEINQVLIREDTFSSSVELLIGENNTITRKNEVLANIFALQIIDMTGNPALLYKLIISGDDILANKELQIESSSTQIAYDVGDLELDTEDIPRFEIFPVVDPNVISSSSYPAVNLVIKDDLVLPSEIEREMTFDFSNSQDMERLVLCTPSGISNIQASQELAKTFIEGRLCLSLDTSDLQELTLSFTFEPSVETLGDNEYNVRSALINTPGLVVNYDIEVGSAGYEFSQSDDMINSGGKLIISGELIENKIIDFSIRK
ncbi:NAD(P)-dependent oxidoreductase [Candidatus Dojkabacteria bacterium]|nr:NAD(P)-dependent oxidoreductase [Candidatus Dojkabacteria bacterium]